MSEFTTWLRKHGHKDLCPLDNKPRPIGDRIELLRKGGGSDEQIRKLEGLWKQWRVIVPDEEPTR